MRVALPAFLFAIAIIRVVPSEGQAYIYFLSILIITEILIWKDRGRYPLAGIIYCVILGMGTYTVYWIGEHLIIKYVTGMPQIISYTQFNAVLARIIAIWILYFFKFRKSRHYFKSIWNFLMRLKFGEHVGWLTLCMAVFMIGGVIQWRQYTDYRIRCLPFLLYSVAGGSLLVLLLILENRLAGNFSEKDENGLSITKKQGKLGFPIFRLLMTAIFVVFCIVQGWMQYPELARTNPFPLYSQCIKKEGELYNITPVRKGYFLLEMTDGDNVYLADGLLRESLQNGTWLEIIGYNFSGSSWDVPEAFEIHMDGELTVTYEEAESYYLKWERIKGFTCL